ncbi:MAG: PQQ-binding-like beta-propeller repeat protein, partial [Planctomycetaceae bacterium]
FDKNTGKELWKNLTASAQGYVPPMIIEAGGTRQLILMSPQFMASVDPETGKKFWEVPYGATNGSIIMTPIHFGNYLYVAGYSNKNLMVKLAVDKPAAEVIWQDKPRHAISPVNVQPILDGDVLYGVGQGGKLYGIKLPSGDRLWENNEPVSENGKRPLQTGTAFIVRNGDRYIFFNEHGELILGNLTPSGFEEIDRTKVIEPTGLAFGRKVVWSMPAFANKHAYIRNDKELICVDLAK